MTEGTAREAWERFEADMKGVAAELKRHYKDGGDDTKNAELNRSLEQLRAAADAVFSSLETASRDPEVHARTRDGTIVRVGVARNLPWGWGRDRKSGPKAGRAEVGAPAHRCGLARSTASSPSSTPSR